MIDWVQAGLGAYSIVSDAGCDALGPRYFNKRGLQDRPLEGWPMVSHEGEPRPTLQLNVRTRAGQVTRVRYNKGDSLNTRRTKPENHCWFISPGRIARMRGGALRKLGPREK